MYSSLSSNNYQHSAFSLHLYLDYCYYFLLTHICFIDKKESVVYELSIGYLSLQVLPLIAFNLHSTPSIVTHIL